MTAAPLDERVWCLDQDNVVALGRWLIEHDELETPADVLYYFEKPWKWTDEYQAFRAAAVTR